MFNGISTRQGCYAFAFCVYLSLCWPGDRKVIQPGWMTFHRPTTGCAACSGTVTVCPRPIEQPPTQSSQIGVTACMSVMRGIVLHLYTMFEVRSPSRSEDMVDFRSRR